MTPAQKQALFTLRQALSLCDAEGIEICADFASVYLGAANRDSTTLSLDDIDEFEKELGE